MKLLRAFLLRDYLIETSYRTSFLVGIGGLLLNVLVFYFLSQFIDQRSSVTIEETNGDYFSFVLIGIAFAGYFGVGLTSFSRALRLAQTTGTLEAMMMTPVSLTAIITGSAAWSYVFTTFRVFVYLLVGIAFFGISLAGANYAAAVTGLVLSIISFASIGIISASIVMVIKRGDALTALVASLANLVGGVYYPVAILPQGLQLLAKLLPITYALRVMRQALLAGASWEELAPDLVALSFFCLLLFPISLVSFRYAVQRARVEGTLAHY
jgi:ABC-2 type transport system permease protein